jgi:RimJ/RimL family protein N-acetyltransferase
MSSKPETHVALRPMTSNDVEDFAIALMSDEGTGQFQWFGFTSSEGLRRRHRDDGLITDLGGVLAIDGLEGRVGQVEWFPAHWGRPGTSLSWTIAIGIDHLHRNQGIGSEAQRQLVTYLFLHTRAERIQAFTDKDNIAEQRALVSAGFSLEGTIRRSQWRSGSWHDLLLYSILRSDATSLAADKLPYADGT